MGSSQTALMHNFEEESESPVTVSLRKSLHSTLKRTRHWLCVLTAPLRFILTKFKLLFVIACYSVFGAWMFMTLEVPTDLAAKEQAYHARLIAREIMILNLRAIHQNNKEDREERWKESILSFENDLGLEEPVRETAWTFWMAFLYAGTIYTTIGYGNIACATTAGKVATICYSMIGIPIMLVILNDLGSLLLVWVKCIASNTSDFLLLVGVRIGVVSLRENSEERLRYIFMSRKLASAGLLSTASTSSAVTQEDEEGCTLEEPSPDPPVFSALFATFAWIMLSAAVFCIWEDWTYFTSIYFFFISCSTIGLGDVTPDHPEYMIATFGVVMVGLSLVSVCIDVVKEKIELMYMALLKKLLQDYLEAVKNGDPNAAAGMMAGFQGRTKFLLPLISKDRGAKVMNRFKEDCTARGIDPPAVLVDLDPNTGIPAFANANKEDFNDYIEHALERRADEEKKEFIKLNHLLEQNRMRESTEHSRMSEISMVKLLNVDNSCCQTEPAQQTLQTISSSVQASHCIVDQQNQTTIIEKADIGIQSQIPGALSSAVQVSQCMVDQQNQTTIIEKADIGVQSILGGISSGVQVSVYVVDQQNQTTTVENAEIEVQTTTSCNEDASTQCGVLKTEIQSREVQLDVSLVHFIEETETDEVVFPASTFTTTLDDVVVEDESKDADPIKEKKRMPQVSFMKNTGEQTDYVDLRTIATAEVATQSDTVTTQKRRSQTRLSSIDIREFTAMKEMKRKSRSLALSTQQHSQYSSIHSSTSDGSAHPLVERPAMPITKTDIHKKQSISEVNVTLSFVKKPVDEQGVIVHDLDDEIHQKMGEDDVFLSDSDLEDVEQFLVEESTQTYSYGENSEFDEQLEDRFPQVEAKALTVSMETQTTDSYPCTKESVVELNSSEENLDGKNPLELAPTDFSREDGSQTNELIMLTKDAQTMIHTLTIDDSGTQTDVLLPCTSKNLAATSTNSVQSDVSMFTARREDVLELERQHNVRFNVDSETSMERKYHKTVATQSEDPGAESVHVQCSQAVSTSQTQCASNYVTDDSAQTEVCTKNRKNQECDATVEARNVAVQVIFTVEDIAVQAVTSNSDSIIDNDLFEADATAQTDVPLWSDFDRIPMMLQFDTSQETTPVDDTVPYIELEVKSFGEQTMRREVIKTLEKHCEAKVEVSNKEVQAVVESHDIGVGEMDSDDWIKVYVAELDSDRQCRLTDIGIQTGVLARVQHMYGNEGVEVTNQRSSEIPRPRFSDPGDSVSKVGESMRMQMPRTSSVSALQPTDAALQRARGALSRTSVKKSQLAGEAAKKVSNLRARFEGSSAGVLHNRGRARSSSSEQ